MSRSGAVKASFFGIVSGISVLILISVSSGFLAQWFKVNLPAHHRLRLHCRLGHHPIN